MTMMVTTESGLLDAARALAPAIQARRAEIERGRRVPTDLVETFRTAGFYRMWLPKAFGGSEAAPLTFFEVVEEIARADGSAGWNVMIGAASNALFGYLPEAVARVVLSSQPDPIGAGSLAPRESRARRVPGGYRLTGRWSFGSGIENADWLFGGAFVADPDGQISRVNGVPQVRQFVVPATSARVLDTWRVTGLRGTGSHDWDVSDLFVPEACSIALATAEPVQPGLLYAFPIFALFVPPIAAVPLGIARAAIDEFLHLAQTKTPTGTLSPLRDRVMAQVDLARAEARLRSGRAWLVDAVGEIWEDLHRGRTITVEQRAHVALAAVHAGESAVEAVDLVCGLAGTTALYESSPLERFSRDAHAAVRHLLIGTPRYETVGRALLGLDVVPAMI